MKSDTITGRDDISAPFENPAPPTVTTAAATTGVPGPAAENQALRAAAEMKLRADSLNNEITFVTIEEGLRLLHELRVHQIELETQNEELRRTRDELEASRMRYFQLYDLAPVGYVTISDTGLIMEANLTAAVLLNLPRNSLVSQPFTRFIARDDQDIYYLHRKTLFETGTPQNCEVRMLRAGAGYINARIEAALAQDENGIIQCRAIISDVSAYKAAEVALAESEKKYKRITAGLSDYLYTVKVKNGKTVESIHDDTCMHTTGYSSRELADDHDLWISMVVPEDRERVIAQFAAILKGKPVPPIEHRIIRKDGQIRWIRNTAIMHHNADSELISYEGVIKDITEYKEATLIAQAAATEVRKLLDEKEFILHEVHHRIKNNMATIGILLSMHARRTENAEAKATLIDAAGRVQSMMVLYEKLYCAENFNAMSLAGFLSPLIDHIVSLFPNSIPVKVEKRFDDMVLSVKQLSPLGILINELITNAFKHAFAGRESGLLSIAAQKKNGRVIITLADDGIGMPEKIDLETSAEFGLQLVHRLTRQLQGTMTIERGNGTKFILEFQE